MLERGFKEFLRRGRGGGSCILVVCLKTLQKDNVFFAAILLFFCFLVKHKRVFFYGCYTF